ncbi:hypothetical protein GCM10010260_84320 [Streptomyces filipinensis]|uniref:Uncharacterized protein n=1 Tax=Streptomyces filipinensis TaxID=66887 RepID=A0A918IKR7_9ACTN|nr:hypothetical protein [Streptomyces filipinensis]GGV31338.1 hypothetical protein GCM10010260_84320 [Streptomyces filipinensis]
MSPSGAPTPVYTPQPIVLGPGQALAPAAGFQGSPVVIIQQAAPEQSWLKAHAGQLIAAGGAGAIVVAVLLAVAVVAIAVGIGAISCALGWFVIKSLMGQSEK